MHGNCGTIVNVEHFEAHGGAAAGIDQGTEQHCLQHVVVGVVMLFTEKHKPTVSQPAD